MTNKTIHGDFYDPTELLSYNRHVLIAAGARSLGKSTNFNVQWLKDYVRKGQQYIYVRRTMEETKKTAGSAFEDAVRLIQDYGKDRIDNFDYEKEHYYLDKGDGNGNQCCGFTIPLATEMQYKSNSAEYENVGTLFFDEAVPQDQSKFLGNKENRATYEYERLMSLYSTVARRRGQAFRDDCKIVMASNVDTFYSPIFMSLCISDYVNAKSNGKIIAPKEVKGIPCEWAIQILKAEDIKATEDFKNSPHYRLAALSDAQMAYNFGTGNDNDAFIQGSVTGKLKPLCNLLYHGDLMGVFYCENTGYIWISKKPCRVDVKTLALTPQDLTSNTDISLNIELCNNGKSGHPELILIYDSYRKGWLRFQNGKVKFNVESFFMFI